MSNDVTINEADMNAQFLETARRQLAPYRQRPGAPESTIYGVPLSVLDKDELVAVVRFQAARGPTDDLSPLRLAPSPPPDRAITAGPRAAPLRSG